MSISITAADGRPRRPGQSTLAIVVAILANVLLALGTDQVLHVLDVYPPWGEPMFDTSDNLIALAYRTGYGVLSGYLVARLAPDEPMRHATILGVIATMLATAGAFAAITQFDLGPAWYPIALAILSFPTVWLGATVHVRRTTR